MYEVMEIGEDIQELILVGASAREIKRRSGGGRHADASTKRIGRRYKAGHTTLDEVLRETVLS